MIYLKVRADFPILSRTVYGKPLVYLDNAATTQKPLCVLDAMRNEYLNVNANVHSWYSLAFSTSYRLTRSGTRNGAKVHQMPVLQTK